VAAEKVAVAAASLAVSLAGQITKNMNN